MRIIILFVLAMLVACTIGYEPCKKNPNLPKGHECDRFLF